MLCAGPTQTPPPHPPLRARFAARAATTLGVADLRFIPETGGNGARPGVFVRPHEGCGRAQRSELRMKVEGDYTCDICGESFETNVEIAGHMRSHQVSIPAETIIDELQRLSEEKGRVPKQSEIEEETEFTKGAVRSTFGSWDEGLEAAKLEPRTNGYSNAEIIEELQRVASQIGHSPSRNEWRELGRISAKAVQTHFGSWNEGLRAANLETTTQQTSTEEDAIEAVQNLAAELGRPPKAKEMDRTEHGR